MRDGLLLDNCCSLNLRPLIRLSDCPPDCTIYIYIHICIYIHIYTHIWICEIHLQYVRSSMLRVWTSLAGLAHQLATAFLLYGNYTAAIRKLYEIFGSAWASLVQGQFDYWYIYIWKLYIYRYIYIYIHIHIYMYIYA